MRPSISLLGPGPWSQAARRWLLGAGCILATAAHGQSPRLVDHNTLAWFGYMGDHQVAPKWAVHTELQWRRVNWLQTAQQVEGFLGAERELTSRLKAAGGGVYAQTHRYGDHPSVAGRPAPERRTYEELSLKTPLKRLVLTHRLRLEQRWLGARADQGQGDVQDWVYQNRLRYQLAGTLPLRGPALDDGEWYLTAYDEAFLGFGRHVTGNPFSENRLAGGLGYQASRRARAELLYLQQLNRHARPDPVSGRPVVELNQGLQLMLFYNLDFTRQADQ